VQLTGEGLPAALPLALFLVALAAVAMGVVHLLGRLPAPWARSASRIP